MTENTEQMIEAGMDVWRRQNRNTSVRDLVSNIYDAMREMEPVRGYQPATWHTAYGLPSEGERYNDPGLAGLSERLTALTALVLELARRSEGYPAGDETLKRLIANL